MRCGAGSARQRCGWPAGSPGRRRCRRGSPATSLLTVAVTSMNRPALSPRQRQVITLIAAGHTNPAIAGQLGITLGTVKKTLKAAMQKLCAQNRAHAVLLAAQAGELR